MRPAVPLLAAVALLAILLSAHGPVSPAPVASASHLGGVECGAPGQPASDGVIGAGEYCESYFDEATKFLVYFSCDNSTHMLLHVGIVTPWDGWAGLMLQARDPWDGRLNEVRFFEAAPGSPEVVDGFRDNASATFETDASVGGSNDVTAVAAGTEGAARVFEFTVPLHSDDAYDSQLQSGPVYFALDYGSAEEPVDANATVVSDLLTLALTGNREVGDFTYMDFSLPEPARPMEDAGMLVALRDETGYPVAGQNLEVFLHAAFGFLDLGPVTTNDQGVAQVSYAPRDEGDFLVGAAYPGGNGLLASVAWRTLQVVTVDTGAAEPPIGADLRPVVAIVVATLAGVWATYGYAFFVTHQTLRAGRDGPARGRTARWRRSQ